MAHTGPEAKPQKLGHSPTADWIDVPDVPYDHQGRHELPKTATGRRRWHPQVTEWWNEVRSMPHCALWTDTDWRFALETCYMKQQMWLDMDAGEMKSTLATEIRRREDQIGTTAEARRKLRIRYVDPEQAAKRQQQPMGAPPAGQPGGTNVVPIADRRARLTS
jgi:hypothetical protein